MDREIKFRGRNARNGDWVYGYFFVSEGGFDTIITESVGFVKVIAGTKGQYTGLKDKNATEIYEGDITKDSEMSYIVKYGEYDDSLLDDRVFGWHLENIEDDVYGPMQFVLYSDTDQMEVIGNIYENPELIEQ